MTNQMSWGWNNALTLCNASKLNLSCKFKIQGIKQKDIEAEILVFQIKLNIIKGCSRKAVIASSEEGQILVILFC